MKNYGLAKFLKCFKLKVEIVGVRFEEAPRRCILIKSAAGRKHRKHLAPSNETFSIPKLPIFFNFKSLKYLLYFKKISWWPLPIFFSRFWRCHIKKKPKVFCIVLETGAVSLLVSIFSKSLSIFIFPRMYASMPYLNIYTLCIEIMWWYV